MGRHRRAPLMRLEREWVAYGSSATFTKVRSVDALLATMLATDHDGPRAYVNTVHRRSGVCSTEWRGERTHARRALACAWPREGSARTLGLACVRISVSRWR